MSPQSTETRLELFVRSLCPEGCKPQQEMLVEWLDDLESRDVIDGYDVHVWGKRVDLSAETRTAPAERALSTYRTFTEWADRNGRSVRSFFNEQSVESDLTGESYRAVVFPTVTLAEYADGDLLFVAPSSDGEHICTPTDRLEELDPEREGGAVQRVLETQSSSGAGTVDWLTAGPGRRE